MSRSSAESSGFVRRSTGRPMSRRAQPATLAVCREGAGAESRMRSEPVTRTMPAQPGIRSLPRRSEPSHEASSAEMTGGHALLYSSHSLASDVHTLVGRSPRCRAWPASIVLDAFVSNEEFAPEAEPRIVLPKDVEPQELVRASKPRASIERNLDQGGS